MTEMLTPEEMAERYCLAECPGGCTEPHGRCMYKPGHLHQHRHSFYDYSGDGSHAWEREQPTGRELAFYLRDHPDAIIKNGKVYIETGRAAKAIIEYLNSFGTATPKKRRRFFGLR